jgi:large subunit ribosomal protein L28
MSRVCQVTGKKRLTGNSVSHSNRKTKRAQHPNLVKKRIYIPEEGRTITVRLSARALRTMNKKGAKAVLQEHGIQL